MEGWERLLQWGGWAAALGLVGVLVTALAKLRGSGPELMKAAQETYRDVINALREEVDDLRERVTILEDRERACLKRVDQLEEALWRRHHG